MNYTEAWQYLDGLQFFKIKLGLDSMREFLTSVGDPQHEMKCIHVAGTNGKGSVSVNLLTFLSAAGYSTGLYTSPHLTSVRERFRINDTYISEEEFASHATHIRNVLDGRQITYFEFTTSLALLWFAARRVDLVILEVGLGGRLDATNVITPLVSVITNVSMDHEAYLGNTLAEVAAEKAGVVKHGVPVVSGVGEDICRTVVEEACRENDAPLYLLGRDFTYAQSGETWDYFGPEAGRALIGLRNSLAGGYQTGNTALALAVIDLLDKQRFSVPDETIRAAVSVISWPGRLESFCLAEPSLTRLECGSEEGRDPKTFRRYLLDGAHNPAGVEGLVEYLGNLVENHRLFMVWASMSDKEYRPSLEQVAPICHRMIFCRPEEERSATPDDLILAMPPGTEDVCLGAASVADALTKARKMSDGNDIICVAGSLYLVGAARGILLGELVK